MRVVHTADVHLDASFAGLGLPQGYGNKRRQSLRDVFHAIVTRAGEWPADALLIAGDLFEQERITRDTIAFLEAEFDAIGHVPVFVAPGNHDPYSADSPYAGEVWPENVHIFTRPDWHVFPLDDRGLAVHGFAFDGPDISSDPFGSLRIPEDGRIHVAVGHGSERRHLPPGQKLYLPFDAENAAAEGLTYFALGHFHSVIHVTGDFKTSIWYSGAPEGHGFGHTGLRHYLEIEIEGDEVRVTPAASSRAVYQTYAIDCTGALTAQQIVTQIRSLARENALPHIARITLTGLCGPDLRCELGAVYDATAGEFEYLVLDDETILTEDYETLAREKTSFGGFIARLNEEIRDANDSRRRMLERGREVGVAAYRGRELDIRGLERR